MTRSARPRPARSALLLAPLLAPLLLTGLVTAAPAAAAPAGAETPELVVVLDSSGSMAEADAGGGQTRMEAAKQAVVTMAEQAPASTRIGLRTYGDGVDSEAPGSCEDTTLRVPVGPVDRDALVAQVEQLQPRGDTPIGTALLAAAGDFTGTGPQSVVLVSDGEPTCEPDPCPVAAQLAAQGIDLRVDVIGFRVDEQARAVLQCVAASGGGTYVDAADAASLASALDTSTLRAFRGYVATGEPVEGTPTPDGAPTLGEGRWLDASVPAPGTHYRVTRPRGGALHVGVVVSPPPGERREVVGGVILRVLSQDGQQCESTNDSYDLAGGNAPLSASLVVTADRCEDDDLLLVVEGPAATSGAPLELAVVAEAPVGDGSAREPAADPDATYAEPVAVPVSAPVRGGSGFGLATPLAPGGYEDLVRPGENVYYRVPVGWGQQLAARVELPEQPADSTVARPAYLSVTLHNALGGRVADGGGDAFTDVRDPVAAVWATSHPVRWSNRDVTAADVQGASLAGDVIVRVAVSGNGTVADDQAAAVPVRLSLAVLGEAGEGPAYAAVAAAPEASGPAPATAPPSADPTPEPSPAASDEAAADAAPAATGGGPLLPVLVTLAVVLVLALLGLLAWGVRRTRRARPSA